MTGLISVGFKLCIIRLQGKGAKQVTFSGDYTCFHLHSLLVLPVL